MKKLIILAAALVAFSAGAVDAKPKADNTTAAAADAKATKTRAAPKYDCTKKGNLNKEACRIAAGAAAVTPAAATGKATPSAPAKAASAAAATKERAAPHYDCTKKGNANKAACKAEAAASATAEPPTGVKPVNAQGTPVDPKQASKTATSAAMASTPGHPVCKKGKPCGNSCIAMSKTCHK